MRKFESRFDRSFRRTNYFINAMFVIVPVLIVLILGTYGFVAYKGAQILSDPNSAQAAGKLVGEFLKGVDEGKR